MLCDHAFQYGTEIVAIGVLEIVINAKFCFDISHARPR